MDQCVTTTSNHHQQHEHRGILALLSARSLVGSSLSSTNRWVRRSSLHNGSSVSCCTGYSTIVTNANLVMAGAWNVRRLQNMILIVGPGTPAWNVDVADRRMNNGGESSSSSSSFYSFSGEEEEEEERNEDDGRFVYHNDVDDDASLQMDSNYHDADIDDAEIDEDDDDDVDNNTITSTNNNRNRSNWESRRTPTIALPTNITQSPTVGGYEHQQSCDSFCEDEKECADLGSFGKSDFVLRQGVNKVISAHNHGPRKEAVENKSIYSAAMDGEDEEETNDKCVDESENCHQYDNSSSYYSNSGDSGSSSDKYDTDDHKEFRTQARRWQRQQHDRSRATGRRQQQQQQQYTDKAIVASSMKHGGCINTASWLDCGWQISTASQPSSHSSNNNNNTVMPVSSTEYPTQLLTSGDDTLVKFWDVSQSMGSTSPLPGGSATCTPFSSPKMPMYADDELVDTWREVRRIRYYLPGIVQPVLTLNTGHLANIFHATPVPNSPGKIVTCGADGYLRLHDVVVQGMSPTTTPTTNVASNMGIETSAIIIGPQDDDESQLFYRGRSSSMFFSHHFLSSNVGLVCSERGLLHFDIRLPPRSQNMSSIIPELSKTCKACYPWRFESSMLDDDNNRVGNSVELESAYIFAGGTKDCIVGLYDLRMTGSDTSSTARIVQIYQPQALANKSVSMEVSVSGIDVSKNKRELLVSYESDHIYTFPIDHPTRLDVEESTASTTNTNEVVSELATYGAHLNRLTFLKAAKYAGLNDEYICTGSDSGHAYIYHKQSGSVASLIKADTSTCNGIVPHPTLPVFITYGIDSTAKLWQASTPVDVNVDDSDLGRFQYNSNEVRYQKSIVVDQWECIKKRTGEDLLKGEDLCLFPDEISDDDKDDEDHFLSMFVGSQRMLSRDSSFIGNDMINLCQVVSKCYFTCVKSMGGSNEPVKSGIAAMKTRVNLIKLRHQADRLGLSYNIQMPWVFKHKEHLLLLKSCISKNDEGNNCVKDTAVSYGCLADLIPDKPSDWLAFDMHMANPPHTGGMKFNLKHKHYHLNSSADYLASPFCCQVSLPGLVDDKNDNESAIDKVDGDVNDPVTKRSDYDPNKARNVLLQTITILKEAGNQALKASLPFLAARQYDKAINYCSVAYIKFPVGNVKFLNDYHYSTCECKWDEILKLLIAVRLNLALVCLSKEINDAKAAAVQASLSLKELKAFATQMGTVLTGEKLKSIRSDEPHKTFHEAKALQAKAYFRLGSAQLAMCDYGDAVKTFEKCVASTKDANLTVDAGIVRKMNEAMRCHKQKNERQRKKYKAMFVANEDIVDGK